MPAVPTPIRRRALWRVVAALGDTQLQVILAAIITVGAGFGAWTLAATAFAGPPKPTADSGVIDVAIQSPGSGVTAPIDVQAQYSRSEGKASTDLELSFTQIATGGASKQPPPHIVVFLCGSIARKPDFIDADLQRVRWQVPILPGGRQMFSSLLGALSQCVYTTVTMNAPESQHVFRQALLTGSSGSAISYVSGTRVLYTLPGIVSVFVPVSVNDSLPPVTLPPNSTLAVSLLNEDPGDFANVFASPQLPDAGTLRWKSKLGGITTPVSEYRLEADSLAAVSALQSHLFIAGALVGVAGGAFVSLVQLCGQAGYQAAAARARRTESTAPEQNTGITADHDLAAPAVRQSAEPDGAGLGWPG